jgi:hypothetical protein
MMQKASAAKVKSCIAACGAEKGAQKKMMMPKEINRNW